MRPRREDAPAEAGLPRQRGRDGEAWNDEREGQGNRLDTGREPVETEDGATLRPLARALLALAEQLMGEEAP